MNVANITITDNIITVTDAQKLTSGSIGDTVSLTWEGEWGNLRKHIVFRASDSEADIILPPAILEIPAQLLEEGNRTLTIAAYGEDSNGTKVIVTEDTEIGYIFPGTDRSYRREPYPGWAAQIEEAVEEANDTANSVRNDANIGKFDGATYTPNSRPVNGGHELSWTNNKGRDNPDPIIIKDGPIGPIGPVGPKGDRGDPATESIFAVCTAEAAPSASDPVSWYIPKTMPRPTGEIGMMLDVLWKNGRENGLGYDVSLIWGEEGGADNEVIVAKSSVTDSLTGSHSIPTEGTVRYQLEENSGRKRWRYVSGPVISPQFSSSTAAAVPQKEVPGMEISYLPGMEIFLQLDRGNTADLMTLVPAVGPSLPVYGNGTGAKTGDIPAGYILHLKNAGDHWQIINGGSSGGGTGKQEVLQVTAFTEGIGYKASHNSQEIKTAWDSGMAIFLRFDAPDGSGEQSYDFQTYKDGLAYFRRPFKGGNQVGRIIITIDNKSNVEKVDDFTSVPEIDDTVVDPAKVWSSQKINQEIRNYSQIDDAAVSTTATWSSQKINQEIRNYSQIDDAAVSTGSTWSSRKIIDSTIAPPDYSQQRELFVSKNPGDITKSLKMPSNGWLWTFCENGASNGTVRSNIYFGEVNIASTSIQSGDAYSNIHTPLIPVRKDETYRFLLDSTKSKYITFIPSKGA